MNIISPLVGPSLVRSVLPASQVNAARPAPSSSEAPPESESVSAEKTAPAEKTSGIKWWSKGSFSFKDILDMLNPLQHLPIISTLYRAFTGEGIGGVARIIGGAIYGRAGGIASMVSSVVNAVFGAVTGKDIGERVYAAVFGGSKASASQAQTSASVPASLARDTASRRLVLSVAPVAESAPAGRDKLTYRQAQAPVSPIAEQNVAGINLQRPSNAQAVVPNGLVFPQRHITKDMITALDLYDRMAPVRARAWKKGDPETEDDSALESRRLNSTGAK
jgi:hypothetical protein